MKIHWKIAVFGKVQGVWFRKSTQQEARKLGLNGSVKNLEDGSVFIEVEGDEPAMSEFLGWCSHGPQLADVQQLKLTKAEVLGFNSFEIE